LALEPRPPSKADEVPVPKTRPPVNINDLRRISLTPTISKGLESFVAEWMLEAIRDKFVEKQFGGLRGRSTVHALIDIFCIPGIMHLIEHSQFESCLWTSQKRLITSTTRLCWRSWPSWESQNLFAVGSIHSCLMDNRE